MWKRLLAVSGLLASMLLTTAGCAYSPRYSNARGGRYVVPGRPLPHGYRDGHHDRDRDNRIPPRDYRYYR